MSCDRCEDIHKAQLNGKTNKECECKCHEKYHNNDTWPVPNTTQCTYDTTTTDGTEWTVNTTNCTSDGTCSVINFNI